LQRLNNHNDGLGSILVASQEVQGHAIKLRDRHSRTFLAGTQTGAMTGSPPARIGVNLMNYPAEAKDLPALSSHSDGLLGGIQSHNCPPMARFWISAKACPGKL